MYIYILYYIYIYCIYNYSSWLCKPTLVGEARRQEEPQGVDVERESQGSTQASEMHEAWKFKKDGFSSHQFLLLTHQWEFKWSHIESKSLGGNGFSMKNMRKLRNLHSYGSDQNNEKAVPRSKAADLHQNSGRPGPRWTNDMLNLPDYFFNIWFSTCGLTLQEMRLIIPDLFNSSGWVSLSGSGSGRSFGNLESWSAAV